MSEVPSRMEAHVLGQSSSRAAAGGAVPLVPGHLAHVPSCCTQRWGTPGFCCGDGMLLRCRSIVLLIAFDRVHCVLLKSSCCCCVI